MTQIIPRKNPRTDYRAPIHHALLNTQQFRPTLTYDYSLDGMCYVTDQPLDIESEVCIVMDNYLPGKEGLEGYRSYLARTRWIKRLSINGADQYAAGAQIVARSHEVLATEAQLPRRRCDLCDTWQPAHRIEAVGQGVELCRLCTLRFNKIPSVRVRQCLERYLLGNVI